MSAADKIRKLIAEAEAMIAKIDPVDSPTLSTIWKSELSMARQCLAIVEREAAERAATQSRAGSGDGPTGAPQPDADGWIPWSGGECPVAEDTWVEVQFRGGWTNDQYVARFWGWQRNQDDCHDIIAYRIVKERGDA